MHRVLIILLVVLFSSLLFAQTAPAAPAAKPQAAPAPAASAAKPEAAPAPAQKRETPGVQAPEKKTEAEVAPTAAVITIDGLCEKPAAKPADCKTVITRAQFDKLANALAPDMPPMRRRQLANAYAQLLVMSEAAHKRGLENKPETQQVLQFSRLNALSQLLVRELQQEAAKVPEAEEQKYYNEHKDNYSEAVLQRIFIPKTPPEAGANPPDEKAKAEREKTVKAEAEKIRAAAAAGGDFEKLQKQAYEELAMKGTPPPTQAGALRKTSLPGGQAKVFDLEPGQISELIDEPAGIYIYKLVSKKTLTLPEVRAEITKRLETERMQQAMQSLNQSYKPVFNEAFFGPMPDESGHSLGVPPPRGPRPAGRPAPPRPAPATPPPPPK